MKIIRLIMLSVLMLVFLLSSTGFIIEKYFCNTCNFEHKDLVLLDLKERKQTLHECNVCIVEHGNCTCNNHHDFDNKQIDYFLLDILFADYKKIDTKPVIINLFSSYSFYSNLSILKRISNELFEFSLPPPYINNVPKIPFSILFSVLIL